MEEYHVLMAAEERALKLFSDCADEISFEQERAHQEFLVIFEGLLCRFLEEERVSPAEFLAIVKGHHLKSNCQAIEVIDVIYNYTDLFTWHRMMLTTARQRVRYAKQRTALQEAAEKGINGGESKKNAERHRLDP